MGTQTCNLTRVLVIDDHHDGGESLGVLLGQMGCEVRVTYGGPEAIATAPAFRPQLVITDINMPGLDGYETTKELRKQPWSNAAVFVAYSGVPRKIADLPSISPVRFHRHITKPGNPSDFQAVLDQVRSAGFGTDGGAPEQS
jgi:CheY-like chemotaxis protein